MTNVGYPGSGGHIWKGPSGKRYHFPANGSIEVTNERDLEKLKRLGDFVIGEPKKLIKVEDHELPPKAKEKAKEKKKTRGV